MLPLPAPAPPVSLRGRGPCRAGVPVLGLEERAPRQGSARLPVWSAGEVWRKTEGLQMLSTVELSARVGATASPFPPVAWPHPSLQCPLPRPLGHVLQIHLGEPESPVWPWGRCACGPQEDRLGHTPFNASAELPWPIPA